MLNHKKLCYRQGAAAKNATVNYAALYALCASLVLPVHSSRADEPINANPISIENVVQPVVAPVNIPATSVSGEIARIIATQQQPYLKLSRFTNRVEDMTALYQAGSNAPLWLGTPSAERNINEALSVLENASTQGLHAENYDVAVLRQKLPSVLTLAPTAYTDIALYDTALSLSMLRFLHDLHYGQIDPKAVNFSLKLREKKLIDLPSLIRSGILQSSVASLATAVEPTLPQYQKLKQALNNAQGISTKTAVNLADDKTELRHFLKEAGDLEDEQNGDLTVAVKHFQKRHHLKADGFLGKATLAAMGVSSGGALSAQQITKIELAMERLRWLPEERPTGQAIVVNIPSFQLWAFDDTDAFNQDINNMRVVVGKAIDHQTPVLMAQMSFIDFVPYWNVPYNIVKKEILPKLAKNPNYLASQNMEMVSTGAKGGSMSGRLQQGSLRIRQKPGARNALGKVKFIFPNKSDVYLHDTPSKSLFGRSRRDFSHGCVRVSNPLGLAEFALKNQGGWTRERIQKSMNGSKMHRVVLNKPIPVTFFYTTAFFDQNDKLTFYSDVYQHDARLLAALSHHEDVSDLALFKQEEVQPVTPSPEEAEAVTAASEVVAPETTAAVTTPPVPSGQLDN